MFLPSSSGGTSLDAIDRIAINEVPFKISTIGAETLVFNFNVQNISTYILVFR